VPGDKEAMIAKAQSLVVDSLFFDLEDSVAPQAKDAARTILAQSVKRGSFSAPFLSVRINARGTSYIGDDLAISQTIQSQNVSLYDVQEYKWGFLIPRTDNLPGNCRYLDINENNFSDILNFRIKNADRVNTDIYYFKMLINKLYNGDSVIQPPIIAPEPIVEQPVIDEQPVISIPEYIPPVPENILPPIKTIRINPLLLRTRRR
jgi:hypothetical protein